MNTVLTKIYSQDVRSAYKDRKFESSAHLIVADYCMDSGLKPTDACANDARGSRVKQGYFVKGSEPDSYCDRHILVEYDFTCGGIATVFTPSSHIKSVGMISIEREFPIPILISDAQYVYMDLPEDTLPSFNENEPFYAILEDERKKYFGQSTTKAPFNRLSTAHFSYSDIVFNRDILRKRN